MLPGQGGLLSQGLPPCKCDSAGLSPGHRLQGRGLQGSRASDVSLPLKLLVRYPEEASGKCAHRSRNHQSLWVQLPDADPPRKCLLTSRPVFISTLLPRGPPAALHPRPCCSSSPWGCGGGTFEPLTFLRCPSVPPSVSSVQIPTLLSTWLLRVSLSIPFLEPSLQPGTWLLRWALEASHWAARGPLLGPGK